MKGEIEILNFTKEDKGLKVGVCDIKIIYTEEKWEIFRNVAVFVKENKKWISFPNVKRADIWVPIYERNPKLDKDIYSEILSRIEKDYL